jgi:hypothetical protein
MITILISIVTATLFLLFMLVLFAALVYCLARALSGGEKGAETGQRLLTASFLCTLAAFRMLRP